MLSTIKFHYQEDIRRISLKEPVTFSTIEYFAKSLYGLPAVSLSYLDNEGETCRVACDATLHELRTCQDAMVRLNVAAAETPTQTSWDFSTTRGWLEGGAVPKDQLLALVDTAQLMFAREATLLRIDAENLTVVGDIHGQARDLAHIFTTEGVPTATNPYLFLGDLVDRGINSVGVLATVLAFKIRDPASVYLIRGNHEAQAIALVYGLYDELCAKYPEDHQEVFAVINEMFDYIPLGAVVADSILALHGGLPDVSSLEELEAITRPLEVPVEGTVTDILWSDPGETPGFNTSPRGAGHLFGPDVVMNFLNENNLGMLVRAHQLVDAGFAYQEATNDRVLTLFSASNYCGRCANRGGYAKLNKDGLLDPLSFTLQDDSSNDAATNEEDDVN